MKKTLITLVSMLLLSGACWSDDTANEVKYYDNAKVIRIKNVDGEGFVQRSYEEGNEEATANLPLFEKDTVGTTAGRLGIYLGRLNYLRLDADSIIVLEKIPQLRKTDLNVRVERGSIYLDIENLDNEKDIEIQTPDCGIFILDKGVYRVNVSENAQTEVLVMEGIAEVAGQESSRNVRENQKIVMSGGDIEERPYYFYASEKDDFDLWNEAQNSKLSYARYGTSRYLQNGYEDTEYEMSRSGRWSYMSEFNSYAWIPYNTHANWMPYANGRWVWNPYYGYTWISYDTCGWFTHHYGRWHWSYSFGWHWLPGYHWSPAWVSWFGNDHYYGWSPLSWWNRPVVIINNRWDRNYDYRRGIPHHSRSTIIIRKNELSAANAQRVALKKGSLGQNAGQTIAYRGTAPSDRPALNKVTVINANGKAVTYKQNGIVSGEKYRVTSPASANGKAAVYKYNPAADGNKTGSAYRKKSTEGSSPSASGTYFRSKSSNASRSGTSTRVSSSGSSAEKSSGKTSYRSKSGSSSKAKASSSSSSSSSSGTKKKKKGEPGYLSDNSYKNSTGETAAAAPYARTQSKYSASTSTAYRYSSRVYESKLKSATTSSTYTTFRAPTQSRPGLAANATSPFSSRKTSGGSADYSARGTNTRYRAPASTASLGYKSSSAARSYSPTSSGQSSRSSSAYRSGSSASTASRSTASSSSQSSSGTAVKKK
ncbi:MAG: hypothetical protein KJ808_00140 [Acidobacteria bacterium]|nr:hypothetical protein [Acidobacteriota bacterium]MBU4306264.1 hypothetical protein [Acidobacteriota bacterium]MCG2809961.1 hypothetical protein [Candidatus Aminicenantes bacterium]